MTDSERAAPANRTAAAPGGAGPYFYEMAGLDVVQGGPDYSSALGTSAEGERMMVALMRMAAGTGSQPHFHPNEQWIFVLEGTLEADIAGHVKQATPGTAIYVPSNAVHHARVVGERDVVFFTVKDTSHGLAGIKVS